MLANVGHREIYVRRMMRKKIYKGAVRRGWDGHVFHGARRCAPGFSDACQTTTMLRTAFTPLQKKRLSFQIFHQIIEILLHVSQRISIVIVWHRQMTNVAIYHWWCIFVCGDWVLIWCWKMDSSSDFENFTYLWSLDISQSYGLTAFPKHNKIRLKMHCIGLTRKWHVGLETI